MALIQDYICLKPVLVFLTVGTLVSALFFGITKRFQGKNWHHTQPIQYPAALHAYCPLYMLRRLSLSWHYIAILHKERRRIRGYGTHAFLHGERLCFTAIALASWRCLWLIYKKTRYGDSYASRSETATRETENVDIVKCEDKCFSAVLCWIQR